MVTLLERRREEREALDMIPVGVGQVNVAPDRVAVGLFEQGTPELPDACAGIENDQPSLRGSDLEARRIAAVPHGQRPGAGNRSARAPEPKRQAHGRMLLAG